jgi:uncharacterized OsmC-like protein
VTVLIEASMTQPDMTHADKTGAAIQRTIKAFTRRPGCARSIYKVAAQLGEGLRATTRERDWKIEFDMPAALGGGDTRPTPGVYGRAALVGCIAIGIRLEAVQWGLQLTAVDVSMEVDCDERGLFGLANVPPGYTAFRIEIAVKSPAPDAEVRAMIQQALARSPWLDVFARAQSIRVDVTVAALEVAS